jgi:choline dehydrogenase-like flavoprotein
MGGLEVTRHLLQPAGPAATGCANESGLLGRFFMTHFSGVIAEVVIRQGLKVINRYEVDEDGVYCRRRVQLSEAAQKEAGILNFSSFLHHPPLEDPSHRNPLLSLIFLLKGVRSVARKIPAEYSSGLAYGRFGLREYTAHARNIVLGCPQLLVRGPSLLYKRILRRRKLPSVIIDYKNNRFTLHYHVEHAPHLESRVALTEQTDEHGLRRLRVTMHYTTLDVESILRAHYIIKERLERAGVGTIRFLSDDPVADIKRQISFGGHQIGTTRMALQAADGVVDPNCRVFGVNNL